MRDVVRMDNLSMLHSPSTVVGPAQDSFVDVENKSGGRIANGMSGRLESVGMDAPELGLVRFDGLKEQPAVPRTVVVRLEQGCTSRPKRAVHVELERLGH